MENVLVHYGRRENCEAFFRDGSIQIGTLRTYDQASHGPEIGDDMDGRSNSYIRQPVPGIMPPNGNALAPFDEWEAAPGTGGNLFVVHNIAYNYAMFCTSHKLSQTLCKKFSADYDAAIAIERPFPFFHEITNAMMESGLFERVEFQTVSAVEYRKLELAHGEDLNEALTKKLDHSYQAEVRGLWNNGILHERYYRFKAPLAVRCCTLILLEKMPV